MTTRGAGLRADFPGIAGAEELFQIAFAAAFLHVANLLGDDVLVARDVIPGAEDSDGSGEAGTLLHVAEEKGVSGTRMMLVVDEKIFFGDAVAELAAFEFEAVEANALVAILAEDERFAVLELDHVLAARVPFGESLPGAIVEDVAILQDLDVGRALVRGGFFQGFLQVLLKNVDGARDESGFRSDGQ